MRLRHGWHAPFLAAAAMVVIVPCLSHAAIILHEPFDYSGPYPQLLSSLGQGDSADPSGTGFSGNWSTGAFSTNTAVDTPLITHPNIASSGVSGSVVNSTSSRPFSAAGLTDNGDVQWISFLFNFNGTDATSSADRLLFFTTASGSGGGVEFAPTSAGISNIRTRLTGANSGTSLDFASDATQLAILRITWSDTAGADQVDLWLNPAVINPADFNSLGAANITQTGSITLGTPSIYARNGGTPWIVDEIRMGENLSDVVVPEPASLLLMACGGIGLAGWTFRRRR